MRSDSGLLIPILWLLWPKYDGCPASQPKPARHSVALPFSCLGMHFRKGLARSLHPLGGAKGREGCPRDRGMTRTWAVLLGQAVPPDLHKAFRYGDELAAA